jgi:type 1 glutamine amidotransferase
MLPAKWDVFDEIYQFKNHDRAAVHELLVLDKHPNDKTPGFYPLAWYKQYHKGRVFYTALGHRDDVWDPAAADRKNSPEVAKLFQQHVLGGIRWALGLAEEGAAPQTK